MAIIMKKEIYRYIGMAAVALGFVACANDNGDAPSNDGGKTPIDIAVACVDGEIVSKNSTRAVDKTFEANDKLVAHLQHVTTSEGNTSPLTDNKYSKTVVFTVKDRFSSTEENNTQKTSDITPDSPLYWDDFSDATDYIRNEGHGLRSAWGYCYNGKEDFPESNNHTDEITWEAATDQTSGFKTSDLLWSKTQNPVSYQHGNNSGDRHGTIIIPYTHAMSKATIVLTAGEGFGDDAFKNTKITLKSVNIKGKFTASTATVEGTKTEGEGQYETGDIQMQKLPIDENNKKEVIFECVFVPNTLLSANNEWAEIKDVEGNDYNIYLTETMLGNDAWNATSTASGVNYKLTATIKKQKVDVVAQIADWINKKTSADGKIQFSTDLTNITPTGDIRAGSYLVFMSNTDNDTNYGSAATTRSCYSETGWQDDPTLYWQGKGEARFFRGLAKMNGERLSSEGVSRNAEQGTDLLWATTPQHKGTNNSGNEVTINEGAKISPRTSEVPLEFRHAMSKVKFTFATTGNGDTKVELSELTFSIDGIVNKGTIDISNGKIKLSEASEDKQSLTESEKIVIPQSLEGKNMKITLKDGTTYTLDLPKCKVNNTTTEIAEWKAGESYEYTITLAKEAIQFRALIKDWNKKTGSGDASLDWD